MKGLLRLLGPLIALMALIASLGSGVAGDTANRFIFGFSADARWFAFEEFGVQDGSGFPYSNIYIIDTRRDRWAPGTPIRVRIDDENAHVQTASKRARTRAKSGLDRYGINVPGRLLASNPLNEVKASEDSVTFLPNYPYGANIKLRTKTFTGNKSSKCFESDRPLGLVLTATVEGGQERELYRDTSVPKSRGCPLGYAIADVYHSSPTGSEGVTVVLIYVLTIGFEGKDARFLAIPIKLPGVE